MERSASRSVADSWNYMRTDCRGCHSKNLEMIIHLEPTPIGDDYLETPRHQTLYPLDLYQCQDCGLAHVLEEVRLPPSTFLYFTGTSPFALNFFQDFAEQVSADCKLEKDDLVVDIGSNDGVLLAAFQKLGMLVTGFEASAQMSEYANEKGIPTIPRSFGPNFHPPKKAKLITANNVLANMYDLDIMMEGVVDILDKDGSFVFETFYLGDLLRGRLFDYVYHEQPTAFSIKPVKHLMRRYGLSLYRADYVTTRGGAVRYYCGYDKPEIQDDDEQLYKKETYADLMAQIDSERDKTRALLFDLKKQGKTICGYGASITATALIYYFGIGEFLSFLVDDTKSKTDRFSPGLHLKVHPCIKCLETDYVFILTPRLADHFKRAFPKAQLIVPLPQLQIYA
mgnify:FL=1